MGGSCGAGPGGRQLGGRWRVGLRPTRAAPACMPCRSTQNPRGLQQARRSSRRQACLCRVQLAGAAAAGRVAPAAAGAAQPAAAEAGRRARDLWRHAAPVGCARCARSRRHGLPGGATGGRAAECRGGRGGGGHGGWACRVEPAGPRPCLEGGAPGLGVVHNAVQRGLIDDVGHEAGQRILARHRHADGGSALTNLQGGGGSGQLLGLARRARRRGGAPPIAASMSDTARHASGSAGRAQPGPGCAALGA